MPLKRFHGRGFTLLEMMVTVAIVAVLSALVYSGIGALRESARRRSLSADLYSGIALARARAIAKQRTQLIVLKTVGPPTGPFGFYHFEDQYPTPPASTEILAATDVNAIVSVLDPTNLSTVPAGYGLARINESTTTFNGFQQTADAWNGNPLPFPWAALATSVGGPVNTREGCTFCSGGAGGIALLPNGRAIFSDSNTAGGLVVIRQQTENPNGPISRVTGVAVSPSGFVQLVEPQ